MPTGSIEEVTLYAINKETGVEIEIGKGIPELKKGGIICQKI